MEIKDKNGLLLSIIDSINTIPEGLNFFTSDDKFLQVASFKYKEGKELRNHRHILHKGEEQIKAQEILILFEGKLSVRLYDEGHTLVYEGTLHPGEFCIIINGGCGYTVLSDARMLEIKNGPFYGSDTDRVLI